MSYNINVINKTLALILLFAATLYPALAGDEACRIRIRNEVNGLVQVSVNKGSTWSTVGRVKSPANARMVGFAAASYIPHGSVAATAVHGLRIKSGQYTLGVGKEQKSMLFSIEPLEFSKVPQGFGGHRSRSSGIHTDIYAGHSIFRNQSPYVGNAVYLERKHSLVPLPEDYTPREGEIFIITVTRPDKAISEISFENKASGKVVVTYSDGSSEQIASVDRPVKGTGRYDGTTFTGVGVVNTSHGGVLTISTAPTCLPRTVEGGPVETRGGFMIQPYFHVKDQGEESPQVMVIGPKDRTRPRMEGTPPLFFGNINLSRYKGYPESSFRAQVRIDGGEWEDVPQVVGKADESFTAPYLRSYFAAKGTARAITEGVTAVRLLFPKFDADLLAKDLAREVADYSKRVSDVRTVSGVTQLEPPAGYGGGDSLINFYLDGNLAFMCSTDPCRWKWDTTKASNGLHDIQIERSVDSGTIILSRGTVLVKN